MFHLRRLLSLSNFQVLFREDMFGDCGDAANDFLGTIDGICAYAQRGQTDHGPTDRDQPMDALWFVVYVPVIMHGSVGRTEGSCHKREEVEPKMRRTLVEKRRLSGFGQPGSSSARSIGVPAGR